MPVSPTALIAVLLGSILAAGLSAIAARRQLRTEVAPWWGALAVGLGYIVGHLGVATPSIPPGDVHDRIPFIALAGAVVAAFLTGKRDVLWIRVGGAILLGRIIDIAILEPIWRAGEISRELEIQVAITLVVNVLALTNVALLDGPARRSELWVGLTVLAAGSGVVLVLAHSIVLFLLGGTLATVLAASYLGAWGRPIGGGIPVAAAVLTALIVEGSVYASLSSIPALLLAGAPALLWLTRIGPLQKLGPKARAVMAGGLVLIPVIIAIVLVAASRSSDGY